MPARFDWVTPTILGNNDLPVNGTDAATKQYVDDALANVSGDQISNGTSSMSIPTADGTINASVGGNANIFIISGDSTSTTVTLNTSTISGRGNGVTVAGQLVVDSSGSGAVLPAANTTQTLGNTDLRWQEVWANRTIATIANASTINVDIMNANTVFTDTVRNGNSNIYIDENSTIKMQVTGGANTFEFRENSGTGFAELYTPTNLLMTSNNIELPTGNLGLSAGNLNLFDIGQLQIDGGVTPVAQGYVPVTADANGVMGWLPLGARTELTCGVTTVNPNSTGLIGWTIVRNDIGLEFGTQAGVPNAVITSSFTGNLALMFNWQVVWSSPSTMTGTRRAALRENSNNQDVIVGQQLAAGQPIILQATTMVYLSDNSGGIDFNVENYGTDAAQYGGAVTPTGDWFLAPSTRCVITLMGKLP